MKKNRMMRAASALLVAVLLTTCTISGTFAKYVTKDSGTDTARVAKWGVEVTVEGTTFAEQYVTHDEYVDTAVVGTNSVISTAANDPDTTDNVVAPGTDGSMGKITLSGAPEVAVKVTYDATVTLSDWEITYKDGDVDKTEVYCPLTFTIGTTPINGATYTDIATLKADLEAAIEKYSALYPANTDLSVESVNVPLSWAWDFDDDGAGTNDIKDTALGNKADADTITIAVTVTVEQVD